MALPKKFLLLVLGLASKVMSHGADISASADGVINHGYYDIFKGHPTTFDPSLSANWLTPEQLVDFGFVGPKKYADPDIICAKGATPAPNYLTVVAGHDVTIQWTKWPFSHHGPMIEYLANCNGDCTKADKTKLLFNKISAQGLLDPNHKLVDPTYKVLSGYWASDKFREADDTWIVNIPASIAPGNYVLRQETLALHDSMIQDGTQNYPQCFNLKITGSGTDTLSGGTLGTKLYTGLEPGINNLNIFTKNGDGKPGLQNYTIPGPPLHVFDGITPTDNPNLQGFTTSSAAACTPSSGTGSLYQNISSISMVYPPSIPTEIAASLSKAAASATTTPTAIPTGTVASSSGTVDQSVTTKEVNADGDGTVSMAALNALKDQVTALCDKFKELTGQPAKKKRSANTPIRRHSREVKLAAAALAS